MNVNCYHIVYFSVKSFYPHSRSFEAYSCIISYCAAFYLSTFSHDAVHILASPESIASGAPNCKTGELKSVFLFFCFCFCFCFFFFIFFLPKTHSVHFLAKLS